MYRNGIRAPIGALADARLDDEGVAVGAAIAWGTTTAASELTTEGPGGAPELDAQLPAETSASSPIASTSHDLAQGNAVGPYSRVQQGSEGPLAAAGDDQECAADAANRNASAAGISDPYISGRPQSWYSNEIRSAKIREIEAEMDLSRRAEMILHRRLYGLCEKSRNLIRSVDKVSVVGCTVQAWLNGAVPKGPSILRALVRDNQRELDAAYPSLRRRRVKSTRKEDAVRSAMKKALVAGEKAHQTSKLSAE